MKYVGLSLQTEIEVPELRVQEGRGQGIQVTANGTANVKTEWVQVQ